jgi:hypothetical protein
LTDAAAVKHFACDELPKTPFRTAVEIVRGLVPKTPFTAVGESLNYLSMSHLRSP